jgi:hypothetical protein
MSPLEQGAASSEDQGQADPPGTPSQPAQPAGPGGLAFEAELEGSSYQTAPITSLALARWTWAVVGMVIGALLGVLASVGGGYKATAAVQFSSTEGQQSPTGAGKSLEIQVSSDGVLRLAVEALRKDARYPQNGGNLPARDAIGQENPAIRYLRTGLEALYVDGTNLVEIEVVRTNGALAFLEANAIASAVQTKIANDADTEILARRSELLAQISAGGGLLASAAPDVAKLREDVSHQVSALMAVKSSVKPIPATEALPAGVSRVTSGLLGAAGGAFIGALAAVAAGAGRRRPHSPRELVSLAPDLVVRTTVQAGELAGRVMETDRRCVVVLALPDTRFAATQLGMAIAHHLRTHGATVALVDRVSEFSPTTAGEDRLWALRRDVRRNIPANFSADMLVVVCGADEEALSLIAGQSDLLVAVVAKQRKTVLADIRHTVDAVRISEPVVVLAR